MKLLSAILFLALPILAFAQGVIISYPPAGQSIVPGEDFTVQIARPDTLTGSTDVSVAIGVASCASKPCTSPAGFFGTLLYYGPYTPEIYQRTPEYQNFTVSVPVGFAQGAAQLNVAHFSLIGLSLQPDLQTLNSTLVIS